MIKNPTFHLHLQETETTEVVATVVARNDTTRIQKNGTQTGVHW